MRSRFALVALLVLVPVLALQAGSAGARPARSATTWHRVHFHLNAYSDWGSCSHHWYEQKGSCTGKLEEGTFLGHSWPPGAYVSWIWNGRSLVVYIAHNGAGPDKLSGTKPDNWYTFTVDSGLLQVGPNPAADWVTGGTNAPAGHEGGPLFVNLSSHSSGYSFDIHGYLRHGTG